MLYLQCIKCYLTLQVAGVPMKVFKTSTIFEKQWLTARVDAVAACPVLDGN